MASEFPSWDSGWGGPRESALVGLLSFLTLSPISHPNAATFFLPFLCLRAPLPPFPFSLLFLLAPQFHPGCTGHGQTYTHLDSWFTHTSGPLSHRRHTSPCCRLETWGRVVHGRLMGSQRNPRARGQGLNSEAQELLY